MAEGSGFDLNYITERIIGVTFPPSCPDQTYHHNLQSVTQMLLSKHSDRYMVINLSEHSDDLSRLNRKVLDLGWQEQHAPSLHLLCSVCKNMDVWLNTHPDHVLLLHCRGSKDRVGVVISSYILLSTVSSREEQALDLYSMKKFFCDGLVKLMTPSQKRYVQVFGRLINHQIHINSSPLFIHHISIQPIPVVQSTVCQLFIRIYQGSQTIHTTEVSQVFVGQTDRLSFLLNPPQMTREIECYIETASGENQELLFRVQFHTGTLSGHQLFLQKEALDFANQDPRFPKDGVVEVLFSEIIDMDFSLTAANSQWKSVAAVDSLQAQWNFTQNVKRGQSNEGTRSLSSDSGLSSSSLWTGGQTSGFLMNYSSEDNPHLHRVISGFRMEEEQLSFGLSILDPAAVIQTKFDGSVHLNGEAGLSIERETDIIDDDDDSLLHDHASAAFLEHNNRLSLQEMSSLSSVEQRSQTSVPSDDCHDGASSVNSSLKSVPLDLQPQIWVKQSPTLYTSPSSDVLEDRQKMEEQRLFSKNSVTDNGFSESEKDDEFATLALDIDQSIEQLNQLILDLDPEFEPIPTQARSHMPRSASLHTNGKIHSEEKTPITGWKRKQLSDVSEYSVLRHTGFDPIQNIQSFSAGTPSPRGLYHSDSVDVCDFAPDTDSQMWAVLDKVPPTPAFPVSPPTPYVKSGHDFFPPRHISQTNRHYMGSSLLQESRGYVDSMTHASVPSDGELFHSDVTGNTVSCQRMFGSMRSVSTPSSLVSPDSPTQAHSWLEGGSSTPLSLYTPQPSPPLLLSAPNSHSSPRRPPRSLSSSLDVTGLESSLLEAVEGLEALGLDVAQPPLLPLKRRGTEGSETMLSFPLNRTGFSTSFTSHNSSPTRSTPSPDFMGGKPETVKFVQDTSKFWYKPDISREQAITILKDKEPGSFIIRDSHSFRGAYGLAMKVATPPPSVLHQSRKSGDLSNELVRHFLIECTQKGVRLKGCPNEPYFGSLTALVCQHSITPLALPCRLIIPDKDPLEDLSESQTQTSTNSAAELLKQGAACNVWFLGSVDLESLTGVHGVQKATTVIFSLDPPTTSTVVHFKVSSQGITLTDNQRKLFFRRHYAVNTVIFCALDPQDRKWTRDGCTSAKIFGFIARKSGSSTENVCHLFAEHDPEQPASAIVNFVSKVMIGSLKTK